jgi:hypothetical protein
MHASYELSITLGRLQHTISLGKFPCRYDSQKADMRALQIRIQGIATLDPWAVEKATLYSWI